MARSGRKLTLDNRKIKALFPIMINSAPTPKYIAYGLGIQKVETVKEWINAGNVLQEQFDEEIDELNDIFPYEYEHVFENRKLEYDAEFRRLYDLEPEGQIPDRLKLSYEIFMNKEKQLFIENNIARREREILDDIKFTKDEELNNDYRLLIRFARIYQRGKCVVEMGLLNSINKHSHTSKNIALGYKLLQTYNKEDFADQQVVRHEGTIDVNTKSILSLALNYEKQQREQQLALEKNDSNVIDVKEYKSLPCHDNEVQKTQE